MFRYLGTVYGETLILRIPIALRLRNKNKLDGLYIEHLLYPCRFAT